MSNHPCERDDRFLAFKDSLLEEWAITESGYKDFELWKARRNCESPIECYMAAALLLMNVAFYTLKPLFVDPNNNEIGFREYSNRLDSPFVNIHQQPAILEYRTDFLVAASTGNRDELRIVVECDGHDFHERTKEQAEHDRSRDRRLTASGYEVFRFTGREIYRDAKNCADEVQARLENHAEAIFLAKYREEDKE